jgi:beta-glucanase (GH16 family)
MRRALRLAAILVIGATAILANSAPVVSNRYREDLRATTEREPDWADEFSNLSEDRWSTCYWWAEPEEGCANGSSGELQWYVPENVRVEDGRLSLTARRASVRDSEGETRHYTSGIVSGAAPDKTLFSFTYGYAEARMRVPAGRGLWSAFWLLPTSRKSLPEVDVMEAYGDREDQVSAHVHYDSDGEEHDSGHRLSVDGLAGEWHTFGIQWTPERLTWFIDGAPRRTVTNPDAIPHEPMYMLLNLAVGGGEAGSPDASTPFPSSLDVDYVRVWRER